jgi:hypothetical protein
VPRSVSVAAEAPSHEGSDALQAARARWHDARVAARIATTPEEQAQAARDLAPAQSTYRDARRQIGVTTELPP